MTGITGNERNRGVQGLSTAAAYWRLGGAESGRPCQGPQGARAAVGLGLNVWSFPGRAAATAFLAGSGFEGSTYPSLQPSEFSPPALEDRLDPPINEVT